MHSKKLFTFFMILFILSLLLLAGCKKKSTISAEEAPASAAEEKIEEAPLEVSENETAAEALQKAKEETAAAPGVTGDPANLAVLTDEKPDRISLWEGTGFADEHGNDTSGKPRFRRTLQDADVPECKYNCPDDD